MLEADFQNHHIEGFARAAYERGEPAAFNVPLISRITGDLWMGGCRDGVSLGPEFSFVMSLYPWEKYALNDNTQRVEETMYDSSEMPPAERILALAEHVNAMRSQGATLVHCQAGLNRSGLIAALALMIGPEKLEAVDAIALLREKRTPLVLCNRFFERWLTNFTQQVSPRSA